jgi:IS30 family transposase
MLVRVSGKDTGSVIDALVRRVARLPDGLMAPLTWDRGLEMAEHKRFTIDTKVDVYFLRSEKPMAARPQREHNGLLR